MPARNSIVPVVVLCVLGAPLAAVRSAAAADDGDKQPIKPAREPNAIRFDQLPNGIATVLGSDRFRSPGDQQSICYSSDGRLIGTGTSGSIDLFDAHTGELHMRLRSADPLNYDSFSKIRFIDGDKRLVAAVYPHARVFVWEIDAAKPGVVIRAHEQNVYDLDVSPDERFIATCGNDPAIRIWEAATGKQHQEIKLKRAVNDIEFSADGRELYCWCFDEQRLRRFDWSAAKELDTIDVPIRQVTLLPGAERFVATEVSGRRYVRGLAQPYDELELPKADAHQTIVGNSRDGRRIVVVQAPRSQHDDPFARQPQASAPPELQVWDLEARKLERVLPFEHVRRHGSFAISPDNNIVAMAGLQIVQWNLQTGNPLAEPEGHSGSINDLAFSSDGTRLATISQEDSTLRVWEVAGGRLLQTYSEAPADSWPDYQHHWQAHCTAWLTPGEIAAAPLKSGLGVWTTHRATKPRDLALRFDRESNGYLLSMVSIGDQLAVAYGDNIYLFDAASGRRTGKLSEHWGRVGALAATPDGRYLASGSLDRSVVLWDLKTQSALRVLDGTRGTIGPVGISADVRVIAAASSEGDVIVWDGQSGKLLHKLVEPSERNRYSVAVAPDGTIAVGGKELRFYEPSRGKELLRVTELDGRIGAMDFSPDGSILATGITRRRPVLWSVKQLLDHRSSGNR